MALVSTTTDGGAEGAGIHVDIADKADANLPKFVYSGYAAASTPSGWSVSRAANAGATATSVTTGVGTMEASTVYNLIDADANNLNTALNIGVGAFCYSSLGNGGGLFIQTEV